MIKYAEYVVGGFVRDSLLKSGGGYSYLPKDIDYVVTGTSIEDMVNRFGTTIGADFPVWLDSNGNEWALARTERSIGDGYGDFAVDIQNVSIEDDLRRRDFTINAMAVPVGQEIMLGFGDCLDGILVDPYNGMQDLNDKVIRHVSDAFGEDPLRVLRCARFAARYKHLGFTVAPETVELCREMVAKGMLDSVSKERLWVETEKALESNDPMTYFDFLGEIGFIRQVDEWDRIHAILNFKTGALRGDQDHRKHVFIASLENVGMLDHLHAPKKYISVTKKTMAFNSLLLDGYITSCPAELYRCMINIGLWGSNRAECEIVLDACRVPLIANFFRRVRDETYGIKVDVEPGPKYGNELRKARIRVIEELLKQSY